MTGKVLLSRCLIALLLACATAGGAQQELPCAPFRDGRVDPKLVAIMLAAAEHGHLYRIDPANSRIGFCVDSHFMRIEGYFSKFQGGMALHPYEDTAEQMMVLVYTDSLTTRPAFVENMLKGESFFDTRKHPDILFFSTGFNWSTRTTAVITGELTLHGVTRPVDFNVTFAAQGNHAADSSERIRVNASTTISRSQFGMDALWPVVDDTVELCLGIDAVQYRQPESMLPPDADTASGFNE
jgi:polyisoprenoid-binding protein YceI